MHDVKTTERYKREKSEKYKQVMRCNMRKIREKKMR